MRVALKIHLRDEPLCETMPEDREMDMRGPPVVHAIGPRVGARLDCTELVRAIFACDRAPASAEVWIEWRKIAFFLVAIPTASICLPKFEQGMRHAASVFVEHATVHDDAGANRALAFLGVIQDQIVIECAKHCVPKHRRGFFAERCRKGQERRLRATFHAGFIGRGERVGLPNAIAGDEAAQLWGCGTHRVTPISA